MEIPEDVCRHGRDFEEWFFGLRGRKSTRIASLADFADAVLLAIKRQEYFDWNPLQPKTKPSQLLYDTVEAGLKVRVMNPLRFFVGLRTPIDYKFGVDAFFVYDGIIVCVDITLDDLKTKSNTKADVIIGKKDVLDDFKMVSESIVRIFKTRRPEPFLLGIFDPQ